MSGLMNAASINPTPPSVPTTEAQPPHTGQGDFEMNNARPITISDNEKVINTKRRISAKTWNQDYTRMSGFQPPISCDTRE